MNKVNKENKGTILAVIAAVISGVAIIANKMFIVDMEPVVFTSIRSLIIGVAFFLIIYYKSEFDFNKLFGGMKKSNMRALLLIAIVGGAAAFLLFFTGLKMTTGGKAAFLQKTLPIYVAVFSYWFLKEKIPMKQTYALIIMMLGTMLVLGSGIAPAEFWTDPVFGDFLVIGATVLWAIENTIARKTMIEGDSNWIVAFSRMFIGGLILFGVAGIMGKFGALMALTYAQTVNILVSTAILLGYVFCWYWSIRLINVSKASTILLIAPVISLVLGVAVLGEPVPLIQLAGSALILIGACIVIGVKSQFTSGV